MDEHKLAELFRDAVREAPPSSFDEQDVLTTSRQVTARRRRTVLTGSAFGAVLLAGGLVLGPSLFGGTLLSSKTAAPDAVTNAQGSNAAGEALSEPSNARPGSTFSQKAVPENSGAKPNSGVSGVPPLQGGGTTGKAGPLTGSTLEGCGQADRELAAALADELPAAASASGEAVPQSDCAPGARGVLVKVKDGGVSGAITVVLLPVSEPNVSDQGGAFQQGALRGFTAVTPGRRLLTVQSKPDQESDKAPFAGRIEAVAKAIAAKN